MNLICVRCGLTALPVRDGGPGRQRSVCDDCLERRMAEEGRRRDKRRAKRPHQIERRRNYRNKPEVRIAKKCGISVIEARRMLVAST